MKTLIRIIITLLCIGNILSFAQNNVVKTKTSDKKKNNIDRDLNKLEAESIKAISLKKAKIIDTLSIIKDTIIDSQPCIESKVTIQERFTINDKVQDSSKINILSGTDTCIKVVLPNIDTSCMLNVYSVKECILSDTMKNSILAKDTLCIENRNQYVYANGCKMTSKDSLLTVSFQNAYKTADSIHNANKYWLDSVMAALPKKKAVVLKADDEIEIYVSGGGLYGGVNPKIYDVLKIYNSGLVHRDYKTKMQGEQTEEKIISKNELRKLAQYIISMGFFDFNKLYDCDKKDGGCISRLKSKPEPIPLSISVRIGERRMRTYVTLFAPKMESNWVSYPVALEKILDAIYDTASK